MNFKKGILFLHRWLGFISGLVVFIVSITGCIFCFQDEIQDAVHSWRKVTPVQQAYLAPSTLKNTALSKYPGSTANYMYYLGVDRPAMVIANVPKLGFTDIYLNPYNGQILHAEGIKDNFFTVVEYIHLYLLLPAKVGSMIVGVSAILFVAIMVMGIVLWWPKRKSDRKRSFTIKWNGRWRRVNYDLHNVLGFYAAAIGIILAITGIAIDFNWMDKGIYKAANFGKSFATETAVFKSDSLFRSSTKTLPAVDQAFFSSERQSPQAEMFLISENDAKSGTIGVTAYAQSLRYGNNDTYTFDKYSGKLLQRLPNKQKSMGLKLNELNYDIHVGQALGLFGKILAFLASLICASLPVTGFIIWWGKRNKSKSKQVKAVVHRKLHKQMQLK
ncbi:PepSY-associated TM helix domain-containing protein [Mucilaginibacter sp.]